MRLRIHGKARGSFRFFERVAPAQDGQHVGSPVLAGRQRPGLLPAAVIQGVHRPRKAVDAAGGRRIRRRFAHLHRSFFRRQRGVCQLGPGHLREILAGGEPFDRRDPRIALRGCDLTQIIVLPGEDLQFIRLPVTPGDKNAFRLLFVAGILDRGVKSELRAGKPRSGLRILFDDSRLRVARSVGHLDPLSSSFQQRERSERFRLCLVSLRCIELLQIIRAGITVKDCLVRQSADRIPADRNGIQKLCTLFIRIDIHFLCTVFVRIQAEIDVRACGSLVQAVRRVGGTHVRIGGYFHQDDRRGVLLLDPPEDIGLSPVPVILDPRADINEYFILIRRRF